MAAAFLWVPQRLRVPQGSTLNPDSLHSIQNTNSRSTKSSASPTAMTGDRGTAWHVRKVWEKVQLIVWRHRGLETDRMWYHGILWYIVGIEGGEYKSDIYIYIYTYTVYQLRSSFMTTCSVTPNRQQNYVSVFWLDSTEIYRLGGSILSLKTNTTQWYHVK